jgi:muconate cycloisomerase
MIDPPDTTKEAGPRISRIELTPVQVPFRPLVREAMAKGPGGVGMAIPVERPWTAGDFVIARVMTDDGRVGLAEAFVWLPETGVTPAQVIDTIEHGLAPFVLGESPFNVARLRRRMDNNVARSEVAKGLLDMACYDLMGKIDGRSAAEVMGGREVERVPLCALIPLMEPDAMASMARGFYQAGYRTFRAKLGRGIDDDVKIMARLRAELGDGVRLRVDYNQAYRPDEAVAAISAIEPYGIDCAEQPVAAADVLGMREVQARVKTPLMAHEGCFSLTDVMTQVELGAVRIVGINSERPGGVTAALAAIDFASSRGLGVIIHNQPLGIASAMHLHLASARHSRLHHAIELFGDIMFDDDLILSPLDYTGGTAAVPPGPGFGVELDDAALARYAVGKTLVIESE